MHFGKVTHFGTETPPLSLRLDDSDSYSRNRLFISSGFDRSNKQHLQRKPFVTSKFVHVCDIYCFQLNGVLPSRPLKRSMCLNPYVRGAQCNRKRSILQRRRGWSTNKQPPSTKHALRSERDNRTFPSASHIPPVREQPAFLKH